jgi:hypothetical protein
VSNSVVVNWRLGRHHRVEGWAIAVRRPDFESILGPSPESLRVDHQGFDAKRRCGRVDGQQFGVQGVENELQCGESLLAVYDRPLLYATRWVWDLLEDDSAEEVGVVLGLGLTKYPVGQAHHVVPERLPLVLFFHTYGRWNRGTLSRCGCINTICGVRTWVSTGSTSPLLVLSGAWQKMQPGSSALIQRNRCPWRIARILP